MRILTAISCAALAWWSASCPAEEWSARDCPDKPIKAFFASGTYAAHETGGDGRYGGFLVDLYRALEDRLGCPISLHDLSFKRWDPASFELTAFSVFIPDGRQDFVPLAIDRVYLLANARLGSLSAEQILLHPKAQLGIIAGGSLGPSVDKLLSELPPHRLAVSNELENLFAKLAMGRIDASFGSPFVYQWFLDKLAAGGKKHAELRVLDLPMDTGTVVGVSMSHQHLSTPLRARIAHILGDLRDTGAYRKMVARYLGEEVARRQHYAPANDPLFPRYLSSPAGQAAHADRANAERLALHSAAPRG